MLVVELVMCHCV